MKIEIETSDIDKIAKKVVEQLTPLLRRDTVSKDNELMTVCEVASHLKVKESWVYDKIHTRQIPFRKAGKFPRFRKTHIDLWIENPYHPDLSIYNLNHNGRG